MKNKDIITLGNGGFLLATAHSLPVEHFYKFVKFKRAVQKAYDEISRAQLGFLGETGISAQELTDGSADGERLDRYAALNGILVGEDTPLPQVRIPIEYYKGVYDENKTDGGDIFANTAVEAIILDNLFTEDEGND